MDDSSEDGSWPSCDGVNGSEGLRKNVLRPTSQMLDTGDGLNGVWLVNDEVDVGDGLRGKRDEDPFGERETGDSDELQRKRENRLWVEELTKIYSPRGREGGGVEGGVVTGKELAIGLDDVIGVVRDAVESQSG